MSVLEEKSKLRKYYKEVRSKLSKDEVEERSKQITQNFITKLLPKIYQNNSNPTFAIYLSATNEVSTKEIINHFRKNSIKFCYPKIISKDQPLEFILDKENQELEQNSDYKTILEPSEGERIVPNCIIMPLVAFDHSLGRIGMGGGFFDRTITHLKEQNYDIITIGLAYDIQGSNLPIPLENTDQKLDFVTTETDLFFKKSIVR